MSSSNSSKMNDQIAVIFLGIMNEAMSILQAEKTTFATASSSTRAVSILLSEAINVEERCEVCFHPTEEEVQHTSHP
jgi:hypothetical protein